LDILVRAQLKRCNSEKRPVVGAYFAVAFNTREPIGCFKNNNWRAMGNVVSARAELSSRPEAARPVAHTFCFETTYFPAR